MVSWLLFLFPLFASVLLLASQLDLVHSRDLQATDEALALVSPAGACREPGSL